MSLCYYDTALKIECPKTMQTISQSVTDENSVPLFSPLLKVKSSGKSLVKPKPKNRQKKLGPYAVLAVDEGLQTEILASTQARPIAAISPTLEENFPRRVRSPNGTDYFLSTVVGILATYTPNGELSVRKIAEEMLPATDEQKTQIAAVELTTAFIDQLSVHQKRSPNQTDAMAKVVEDKMDSVASTHAEKSGVSQAGDVWQWLHLIAFMLLRNEAQQAGNLVGGLKGSNTNMRPIEKMALEFVKQFTSIQLIVSADLIPGTRIARTIHYKIVTPEFELPFTFDALKQKSDKTLWPIMDAVTNFYLDKREHSSTAKTITALSKAKQRYFENLLEIVRDKSNTCLQTSEGEKENLFNDDLLSPPPSGKLVTACLSKPISKLQPIPKPNINLPPQGWQHAGSSTVFKNKSDKSEDRDQSPKRKPLAEVNGYKK